MVGNLMHKYENEKSAFDYMWLVFFSDVYNFSSMSWKCWWWKSKLHWVRWGNALTMHFEENCRKNNSARHQESLLENLLIMNILDNIEDRYRMTLKSFWWHDLQTYAQYLFQFIYVLVYSRSMSFGKSFSWLGLNNGFKWHISLYFNKENKVTQ